MALRSSVDAAAMDYVLQTAQDDDVKFVRLWFPDILGNLKGFAINAADLRDAIEEGVGFDGSAIESYARSDESDMRAFPDPNTFALLPWRPQQNAVARMFCDIQRPGGESFDGDSRAVLKRNLERLARMGYTYYVGTELEYFYLKGPDDPAPLDHGGYFDQLSSQPSSDLRRETVLNLAEMDVPVKYSHHEAAPSQHEIDLQYTDALAMADSVMTARLVVKELAQLRGVYATFMPKPIPGVNGSGMHIHQSLFPRREQRLLRRGRRALPVGGGAQVHCRAAAPRAGDNAGHQPVGQLLQAAGAGLRGPGLRVVVARQPGRPGAGCRPTSRATKAPCASSTAPPTRPATPIWPTAPCWRRA